MEPDKLLDSKDYGETSILDLEPIGLLLNENNTIPLLCNFSREVYFLKPDRKVDELTLDSFKEGLLIAKKEYNHGVFNKEEIPKVSYYIRRLETISDVRENPKFLFITVSNPRASYHLTFQAENNSKYTCYASKSKDNLEKIFDDFIGPNKGG